MADKVQRAKELVESVQRAIESSINKAGFNKKKKAIIRSLNGDGTANITIGNDFFENVKIRSGLLPQVGEVVLVEIPNSSTKDMFIDTAESTIIGDGESLHTHNNLSLLQTITQQMITNWNNSNNTYVHNQVAASDTWIINHNLHRFPDVTIVDSAGSVVVGEIKYINDNKIELEFTSEFSGKAYLN